MWDFCPGNTSVAHPTSRFATTRGSQPNQSPGFPRKRRRNTERWPLALAYPPSGPSPARTTRARQRRTPTTELTACKRAQLQVRSARLSLGRAPVPGAQFEYRPPLTPEAAQYRATPAPSCVSVAPLAAEGRREGCGRAFALARCSFWARWFIRAPWRLGAAKHPSPKEDTGWIPHANAALSLNKRRLLCRRVVVERRTLAEAAAAAEVSSQVGRDPLAGRALDDRRRGAGPARRLDDALDARPSRASAPR